MNLTDLRRRRSFVQKAQSNHHLRKRRRLSRVLLPTASEEKQEANPGKVVAVVASSVRLRARVSRMATRISDIPEGAGRRHQKKVRPRRIPIAVPTEKKTRSRKRKSCSSWTRRHKSRHGSKDNPSLRHPILSRQANPLNALESIVFNKDVDPSVPVQSKRQGHRGGTATRAGKASPKKKELADHPGEHDQTMSVWIVVDWIVF